MKKRVKLSEIYLKNFVKIILPLFISIFILWVCNDIFMEYRKPAASFKKFTINEKKLLLKEVVDNTINFINYKDNFIENKLKSKIKEETYQAFKVINTVYVKYNKILNSYTTSVIKDTLRAIRYHNGTGYFFAFDLDGVEQVFADRPEAEGKNLLNLKDARGNYVLKDMIKIVKKKGEGFYTYYWSKPGVENQDLSYKKIAFIKYFKPLNWIIGTGLYFDDVENEIRQSVKEYIKNFKFGKNNKGRIFIIQPVRKNGKLEKIKYIFPKKHPTTLEKILPSDNILEKEKVKNNLINKCFNSQSGIFATCHFVTSHIEHKKAHKLTYCKYFKKWNWVVVAAVPLNDMDIMINAQKQRLFKGWLFKVFAAFFIILISIFIAFKIFKKTNSQIKEDFLNIILKLKNNFALEKIDNKNIKTEEFFEITEIVNSLIENIDENNKILTAYFNKKNIANYIINESGYFEKINETFTEKVGYTIEDLKKIHAFEIIHKDFREEAKERILRRLKGEYLNPNYECKVVTKTGEEKWFLLISNHIHLESKNKNIVIGSALEITNYKTLTEQLNEQYNLFKTLIDSLHVPVWVFEANSNIFKTANKYFYEYFEVNKNVIGKKPDELFEERIVTKAIEYNQFVVKSKQSKTYENLINLKKGKRNIIITKSPLFDEQGNVIAIVCASTDITDKLNLEKEIAKNKNLESLGILAGGIAHDFNNILTTILGNISLLQFYIKEEKPAKILKRMEVAVKRAEKLSKKLLTFSKGSYLIKESANINDIIKSISEFIFVGTATEIICDFDKNIPIILLDKFQISEVLHNVLLNARQAIEENNGKLLNIKTGIVFVNAKTSDELNISEGNYVKISIKDTGIGIPEDNMSKIFDPYFTTKETGTGLGLATSYSIVKQHKGTINVLSEENKGTLFEIYLPLLETEEKQTNEKNIKFFEEDKVKLKILVLEDEETIRKLLWEIFDFMGHISDFATKGEEAVELYSNKVYDMVICDMTIKGGMGGIETLELLKEINKDVYAVVTTGYVDSNVVANYRKYGFKGVLLKPYTIEKLEKVISDFLFEKRILKKFTVVNG